MSKIMKEIKAEETKYNWNWATKTPPAYVDEQGNLKAPDPEWFIDENGNKIQLVTVDTDCSKADPNYPIRMRSEYFPDDQNNWPSITFGPGEHVDWVRVHKKPLVFKPYSFIPPEIQDECWRTLEEAGRRGKEYALKEEMEEVAEIRDNYEWLRERYDENKDRIPPHKHSRMTRMFNRLLKYVEKREAKFK